MTPIKCAYSNATKHAGKNYGKQSLPQYTVKHLCKLVHTNTKSNHSYIYKNEQVNAQTNVGHTHIIAHTHACRKIFALQNTNNCKNVPMKTHLQLPIDNQLEWLDH